MILDFNAAALLLRDGPQHNDTVRTDVVERIAQQLVGLQIKLPVIFVAQCVVAARDLKAEVAHVKVNKIRPFRTALHFTQLHHAVDERGKPVRLIDNDVALLGTLGVVAAGQVAHGLGVALYQGQRGAQVVADIRQNVLFELGAALQP